MSLPSVTSTSSSTGTSGPDAMAPDPAHCAPISGFDALLAVHADPHGSNGTDDTASKSSDDNSSGSRDQAGSTGASDAADTPPKTKADTAADAEALAAQLAAQAANPTPAPVPSDPPSTVADLLAASTVAPADGAASDPTASDAAASDAAAADGSGDLTTLTDLPAPTAQTELAALLLTPPPTEPVPPAPASPPTTPLLGDRPVGLTREADKTSDPAPAPAIPPGPGPSDQTRSEHSRPASVQSAASNYAPASAPSTPTSAPAVVNAAEAAAATAHTEPPPPAEQLVSVLSPLRLLGNGSYTLHLELKPAELGRVEIRVEMRDGVLHASIHADRESSAQLVRASLTELRDQLASEGVRTGSLSVSDSGVGSSGRDADARQANRDAARDDGSTGAPTTAEDELSLAAGIMPNTDPDTTSLLDVRV